MKCALDGCNCKVEPRLGPKPHVGRQPKYCLAHRGDYRKRYEAVKAMAVADGVLKPGPDAFAGIRLRFENGNEQPDPKFWTSKQKNYVALRNAVSDILIDWSEGRRKKTEVYALLKNKTEVIE